MTENSEVLFRRLLRRASAVVDLLAECMSAGKPPEIQWDDWTAVAVEHLLSWANLETRAALALLRDPTTAPAAEILLRGLLEALAHLSWIWNAPTEAERRCRALCYELGRIKSYGNGLRKMSPDAVGNLPTDIADQVEADLATIRDHLRVAGCRCRGRDEGNVEADLKGLAHTLGLPYIYELWVTSSWVAHQFAFDRIARSSAAGNMTVTAPTLADRAKLLWRVVAIFGFAGQAALLVENPEQQDRFSAAVSRLLNGRALLQASTDAAAQG